MRGLLLLMAAVGACGLVVWFGPAVADRLVALLGDAQQNMAVVETIYTLTIFGALLVIAVAGGAWAKLNPFRPGKRPAVMLASGAFVGAAGILAAAVLAHAAGSLDPGAAPESGSSTLIWGSVLVLFAATAEEVYFRGWLQPALAREYGVPIAILLTAFAFAGLHVMGGARSPTTLVNLALGGLLFGLLAARGGGLSGAVTAHFAWNWTEQIGLGLDPNPGLGSFGALADFELTGAALWGGSDEGLNASLAMTIALLALLVPMLILGWKTLVSWPSRRRPAPAE
jgi:membrane protease YdiL (CAAX protease family)